MDGHDRMKSFIKTSSPDCVHKDLSKNDIYRTNNEEVEAKELIKKPRYTVRDMDNYKDLRKSCRIAEPKRQRSLGEKKRVKRWKPQISHDDSCKYRCFCLEAREPECESPEVSGLRYDNHPSSSQASYGVAAQDLLSKSRASYNKFKCNNKYRHDDHSDSSWADKASHVNKYNMKRRKLVYHDKTSEHWEEDHPSKRIRQYVPLSGKKNRNKYICRDKRNFVRKKIQRDYEEPFDICSMSNIFPLRELSPLRQSNATYKEIHYLMPGMFLLKKWLTDSEQCDIVNKCQKLGVGNGGFFQPSFNSGNKMHLKMMCLGKNWNHKTHKYEEIREHDNAQPPPIPSEFFLLVKKAIEDSNDKLAMENNIRSPEELLEALPGLDPDVCIVNFYEESGKLGLHQDKDESPASLEKGLPVVSFSIGDTAEFCYKNDRKIESLNKIKLESGDVVIFGGESRLVFHSVSKLYPGTAPQWLTQTTSLRPGRLNLTFRQIYL